MFWLSISSVSPELAEIAANTRPWAIVKKFWQFSNAYGEYQSHPPSHRRQFIIEREEHKKSSNERNIKNHRIVSESC